MKPIVLKVKNTENRIPRESAEERAERIRMWPATRTQVIPNKKKEARNKRNQKIDYED